MMLRALFLPSLPDVFPCCATCSTAPVCGPVGWARDVICNSLAKKPPHASLCVLEEAGTLRPIWWRERRLASSTVLSRSGVEDGDDQCPEV
eukprot:3276346-Rhodomonas_salina.1